jgi:hypothetical protein
MLHKTPARRSACSCIVKPRSLISLCVCSAMQGSTIQSRIAMLVSCPSYHTVWCNANTKTRTNFDHFVSQFEPILMLSQRSSKSQQWYQGQERKHCNGMLAIVPLEFTTAEWETIGRVPQGTYSRVRRERKWSLLTWLVFDRQNKQQT